MYIEPDSKIYICANVPLDEKFDDSISFESRDVQLTTINNYFIKSFDKYSYQRNGRGYLRVKASADELYGANYMTFQNTAYGNKWFFAFIKNVDYINDNVAQINYEIDPIQTWWFDIEFKQCFIERQHQFTDYAGSNRIPENINYGELIKTNYQDITALGDLSVVVFATFDRNYNDSYGTYTTLRYYNGLTAIPFDLNNQGITALANWMHDIPPAKLEGLVCAVIMPKLIADSVPTGTVPYYTTFQFNKHLNVLRKDGTPVHNQKCLTYPYNYLYVTNFNGGSAEYKYENFNVNDPVQQTICSFRVYGDRTPNPSVAIVPQNYNMVPTPTVDENFEEKFILTNFPQVALNVDAYKVWLSQNMGNIGMTALSMATAGAKTSLGAETGSAATGAVVGGLVGGPVGALIGGAIGGAGAKIASLLTGGAIASVKPPQSFGSQSGSINSQMSLLNFGFYNVHMNTEYATIVDDYFDMFGYAQHDIGTPAVRPILRESWSYIKTVGCVIEGDIPADDVKKIKDIFDAGIRFWRQGKTVGDYTQNNDPRV